MLFNSVDFIVFFIIILTTVSAIKSRKFQHVFLLASSFFFFYYSSNYLIVLLISSAILDFYVGRIIWYSKNLFKKKILLIISLVGNLGLLGFFKYADFAIMEFNLLGEKLNLGTEIPLLNLALPIGISFYTFQTISYTVDVYRGQLKPSQSLREFVLFVAFFPQLVAGPIIRAKDFLPQLREKSEKMRNGFTLRLITVTNKNLKIGLTLIIFGLFKKIFFADNIGPYVDEIFGNVIGKNSLEIWLATIGFGIQIYTDFSGYSDIAIGAALILGFSIPINFNKPYFATSPSDFWKRWHISLSSWLRDYLYIPLGGNRGTKLRPYLNLMIVMLLGGFWHGASWNFILWGALHGTYLSFHKLLLSKFPSLQNNYFFKTKFGKISSILITQYFVFLAWIPFRVNNTNDMLYSIEKFILLDIQLVSILEIFSSNKSLILLIIIFFILHFISYWKNNIMQKIYELKVKYWMFLITGAIFCIIFFYNSNPEDFIYFRF